MANRIHHFTAMLLIWLVVGFQGSLAKGQTSLRWDWKPDRLLQVQFGQKIENVTTVNKRPIRMDITLDMTMDWRVVDVDSDGGATLEQKIKRLALTLKTPDKPPVEYDSTRTRHSASARTIAETMDPIIGVAFQLELDARGTVKNIHLTEAVQAAVAKASKDSPLASMLSKSSLTKMLQQTSPPLPEQPVQKGDKWNRTRNFESAFGKMAQNTQFTLVGEEQRETRSLNRIQVSSDLKVATPKPDARGVFKSQQMSGDLWFDAQAGLMRESQVRQVLKSERPYRNTIIEVSTTSTLTMKIDDKKPPTP